AVGRPVESIRGGDCRYRVDVSGEPIDGVREPADVRIGQVALERCRFDLVDGERSEDLPMAAQRIAVDAQHGAAVARDALGEVSDRGGVRGCGEAAGIEAAGLWLGLGFLALRTGHVAR